MKISFLFNNPFSTYIVPFTIHGNNLTEIIAKAIKAFNKKGVQHPEWSWKIKPDNRKVKRLLSKLAEDEILIFYTDNETIYFEVTKINNHQRLWELKHQGFILLETHFKGEPTRC